MDGWMDGRSGFFTQIVHGGTSTQRRKGLPNGGFKKATGGDLSEGAGIFQENRTLKMYMSKTVLLY